MADEGKSSTPSKAAALSLGLSRYAPRGATLITGVFLIEIGATYGISVGVTNQLNATNSLMALITAFTMGALALRFNMKTLMLTGIGLAIISTVGCWLSPSFQALFLLYALNGVAFSLIYPMSTALVGEIYPGETRADAFSLIFAVPPIITVFASPAIAYLGDWRVAFLLFALPIALLSLLLIKSKIPEVASKTKGVSLYSAFRSISGNGSALTCLVSDLLNSFTWQIVGVLSISFLREYHYLPRELTSLIYSGFALAVFLGALLGGKVVKSIGRKKSVVVLNIIFGVSALLFVLVPGAYLSATFGTLACFISGLSQPAASSYEIDQIPELRGSIMSLSSAFGNLGGTIGAVIAGFLLLVFGWVIAGVSLGIAAIIGGMILQFFSSEPKEQD